MKRKLTVTIQYERAFESDSFPVASDTNILTFDLNTTGTGYIRRTISKALTRAFRKVGRRL